MMEDFETDPFDESNTNLQSLQSGVFASEDILKDLQNALKEGQDQTNNS